MNKIEEVIINLNIMIEELESIKDLFELNYDRKFSTYLLTESIHPLKMFRNDLAAKLNGQ